KVCCFININPFKTVRVLSQMLGLNQSFPKLFSSRKLEIITVNISITSSDIYPTIVLFSYAQSYNIGYGRQPAGQ
ncbi:MAG: hypothetical protein ABW134_07515, partial [Candidatus Thiodiazotropha endolucinida]